jgi:hypothetical protein
MAKRAKSDFKLETNKWFSDFMRVNSENEQLRTRLLEVEKDLAAMTKRAEEAEHGEAESDAEVQRQVSERINLVARITELEQQVKALTAEKWIDAPDKAGAWWMAAFCEGRYVRPYIQDVIDYARPDRGLEVLQRSPDSIPVPLFVTEYYPKSKWLFIPVPNIAALTEQKEEKKQP